MLLELGQAGIGTWDSTTGTHWSGGVAPVAGDAVVFDGTSGGGTVTADPSIAGIAFLSLTAGAFASGTLDFSNGGSPLNVSFGTVSFTGTATRSINMGSGTWTITGTTANVFDAGTQTSLTPTFQNAAIVFSGNGVTRLFQSGNPSGGYGNITVNNNSSPGILGIQNATTFASITVGSGVTLVGPAALPLRRRPPMKPAMAITMPDF